MKRTTEAFFDTLHNITFYIFHACAIARYEAAMEAGSPYAAVILDLTIPGGMEGKEALRNCRKQRRVLMP